MKLYPSCHMSCEMRQLHIARQFKIILTTSTFNLLTTAFKIDHEMRMDYMGRVPFACIISCFIINNNTSSLSRKFDAGGGH